MLINKLIIQESQTTFFDALLQQLPFFLIFFVIWYFMLRPNMKKKENLQQMQSNLKKGDRVITIGGIHGKVIQVKNNKVVLRVSNNSEITVDTVAISQLSNLNKKESDGS
ncbi:MAG: preprotein translocase subunit YajC [Candidatus Neomarinimicrobiota bacterium]|jgi:preprotein translocase subunit YajC|tara:strand:+ start:476 stop:805 length:330 start_codon:yes stop_codon:yes gene_type:complete